MAAEVPAWEHGGGFAPEKGMVAPLVAGALIQFFLCLGAEPDSTIGGARLLGYMIGAAAPAWLILYFGFGRRRDPDGWWKIPLVIVPVTLVAVSLSMLGSRSANEDKALNSVRATSERILASEGQDAGPLVHSGATGEAGELERITLEFFRAMAEERRVFERDLAAAGFRDVLSPAGLRSRSDIPAARARVNAGRQVIDRYYSHIQSRMDNFPRSLASADLSASARDSAIRGFQQSYRDSSAYVRRMQALDEEFADTLSATLDLLARARWRWQGAQFQFERQRDLDEFDVRMNRLDAITREEEQLGRAQRERARATLPGTRRPS